MTSIEPAADEVVRVHADHAMTKQLGHWTTARVLQVRARRGAAVIDLRSPEIADGDIELAVDIDHGMVKLLLPADATVDQWGIQWTGAGRVKDGEGDRGPGRSAGADHRTGVQRRDPDPPRRYGDPVRHVLPGIPRRSQAGLPRRWHADRG